MSVSFVLMAALGAAVLATVSVIVRRHGPRQHVLTPIVLFVILEIATVWPALATDQQPVVRSSLAIAAVGLLLAVVSYRLVVSRRISLPELLERTRSAWPVGRSFPPVLIWVVVVPLVLLGLYRFNGIPPVTTAIRSILDPVGSADEVARIREFRRGSTKGHVFGGSYEGQGLVKVLSDLGWRHVVLLALSLHLVGPSPQSRRRLLAVGLLAFVFLGSAGVRSSLVLTAVAVAVLLSMRRSIPLRRLAVGATAVVAFVLFISPLSKGESGGSSVATRASTVVERVTDGNGKNNARIVEFVEDGSLPRAHGGLLLERAEAMLPGTPGRTPFAFRLTRMIVGDGTSITGYSTATQFGLLYADWGPVGVVVGYALTGILLALGSRWVFGRADSPLRVATAAQTVVILAYTSVTGIHGFLSSLGIVMAIHYVCTALLALARPKAPVHKDRPAVAV